MAGSRPPFGARGRCEWTILQRLKKVVIHSVGSGRGGAGRGGAGRRTVSGDLDINGSPWRASDIKIHRRPAGPPARRSTARRSTARPPAAARAPACHPAAAIVQLLAL